MGRGRVQLKRIENKMKRQVSFSKRRSGLFKKAHEIAVLCDAEVALIVFSAKGKLYEYSTASGMERILERYERYCYSESDHGSFDSESSQGNWCLEYNKLKCRVESLRKSERNLIGEDLDSLTLKELQNLEQQLETGLKQIRSKKNDLLFDSISDLQGKEKILRDQNNLLLKKLKAEKASVLAPRAHLDPTTSSSSSQASILMPEPLPTLELRMSQGAANAEEGTAELGGPKKSLLPPWMTIHNCA